MLNDPYPSRCAPEPAILPRKDPVVYGQWNAEAPLSCAQLDSFRSDGLLVVNGLFRADEIAALRDEALSLLDDPALEDDEAVLPEPDGEGIRAVFQMHSRRELFSRIAADARLVRLARFILDDEVYVYQSRLRHKTALRGTRTFWQSDFETWHVEDGMPRMRALSVAIMLHPVRAENGPLMFIPGSHNIFVSCTGDTPDRPGEGPGSELGSPDGNLLADLASARPVVAPLGPAGTVILFDSNILYGSGGNMSPFPAATLFIVYNAVSNRLQRPFGLCAPRPEFRAARKPVPVRSLVDGLTGAD